MARQHLHFRCPRVGDLVHPLEHSVKSNRRSGAYADTERVGLVIEKDGLDILVQFVGEKERLTGAPHRLWYRRTNVITIDGVTEIP